MRIGKHGVNPSIEMCFYCQEDTGNLILAGYLPDDAEAPRRAVWGMEPCDKCKEWMKKGVILVSVRDGESGDNPYRTGGWVVITEAAVKRMPNSKAFLKKRFGYIEDTAWDAMGLPRGSQDQASPQEE